MALAVHCQLIPQVRPFVPTVMALKLAYRRGKREGGEEPMSNTRFALETEDGRGDAGWDGRTHVTRLNQRQEQG